MPAKPKPAPLDTELAEQARHVWFAVGFAESAIERVVEDIRKQNADAARRLEQAADVLRAAKVTT